MRTQNLMKTISVGNRLIGINQPVFIVAEVGVNHNGDIQLARDCIEAAAKAGADAVKFQNFRAEEFILDRSLTYTYESQGKTVTESQYEMFKRLELPRDSLAELKNLCDSLGVIFFSSPMSQAGIDDLVGIDTAILKNGSDALTHLPLIRAMGNTGLPTVLSTGMANIEDIENAVATFRETGNDQLILLACTSMYPTPADQVNVSRIVSLSEKFNCLTGFSDHTDGNVAAILSISYDCCFIEKHFTMDQSLSGPDHQFSIDPEGLDDLVKAIRIAELSVGNGNIEPSLGEEKGRIEYRLSCIASQDIIAGTNLKEADVMFSRPGTGMPPVMIDQIVGRRLIRNITKGQMLDVNDFE
jgi:N,N'-diacetyllegionaminate synthase